MKIFTTVQGQGSDIVLLHGCLDDHRYYEPVTELLAKHYRVTNIDQPGCGQTPWTNSIKTIDDLIEVLLPTLPKKAIYIGWSMGGTLNFALAAKCPERVERIVNICSTPKFGEATNWPGMPSVGMLGLVLPGVKEIGLSTFLKGFFEGEFAEFTAKPENYKKINQIVETIPHVDLVGLTERMRLVDETDLRPEYKSIKCPIDFIMGEQDAAVPTDVFEKIKALNSRTKIHVIKEAKHAPFWTHPKEFNKILESILGH